MELSQSMTENIIAWAKECQSQEQNGYFDKNGTRVEIGTRVFDADPFFGFSKENPSAYGTVINEDGKLFIKWDFDDEPTALLNASMLEVLS